MSYKAQGNEDQPAQRSNSQLPNQPEIGGLLKRDSIFQGSMLSFLKDGVRGAKYVYIHMYIQDSYKRLLDNPYLTYRPPKTDPLGNCK